MNKSLKRYGKSKWITVGLSKECRKANAFRSALIKAQYASACASILTYIKQMASAPSIDDTAKIQKAAAMGGAITSGISSINTIHAHIPKPKGPTK